MRCRYRDWSTDEAHFKLFHDDFPRISKRFTFFVAGRIVEFDFVDFVPGKTHPFRA